MDLLAWIVLGGVAGWLASLIVGVGARMGCLLNIVAGVVGAVIGGVVFNALGSQGTTGFNWWSLFVAFVGAVILLALLRLIASIMKD
ncbi:MAG: GlsB/YeaQ/YmgE family stress response membrane protein [Actinomycetia bacterium]|nr:GlsB/YeaQ/YmgE family stress response membrane protein [Actinomycetes bacterium]